MTAPSVRSALFVPASSERFLAKVDRHGADAVILDLEDGTADDHHAAAARTLAAEWIGARAAGEATAVFVRINNVRAGMLDDDLGAIVHPALAAVVLPKILGPADVVELDAALAWHEGRRGLRRGAIRIWPLLETTASIEAAASIAAASRRVAYLGGAVARDGDLAREVGYVLSPEGDESLYLRSHLLMVARAAGVANPMTGMVTEIDDLAAVERFALAGRRLGYEGMTVIHPSHVAIVNRVFAPSAAELADAHGMIAALAEASARGEGAARFSGRMVDTAMAETARRTIGRAREPGPS